MPFARASELDRLLACAGSASLPRQDTRTLGVRKAAEWGTSVHAWLETGYITSSALGERITLSGTDRKRLWPGGLHEITLALNVVTGEARRYYGAEAGRDEWKAAFDDEWVTGTLDFVGELLDVPWVDDLKTGRFAAWIDYAAQQSFYVLAWTRYKGLRDGARSTITHWPRYPKHAPPTREGRFLSLDYLDGYAKQLAQLRETILEARDGGPLLLRSGKQCVYCPSRSHCTEGMNYNG